MNIMKKFYANTLIAKNRKRTGEGSPYCAMHHKVPVYYKVYGFLHGLHGQVL
jgi:hypothetical protein